MPIDYRELLMKYITHVGEEEGIDFLSCDKPSYISGEEWDELQKLSEEARKFDR